MPPNKTTRRWRLPFRCRGSRRESAVVQLFSLGNMTRAQKIWDFVFGVALIGSAPIVTFMAAAFALHFAAGSRLVPLLVLASATIAFVIACIWRRKHRILPSSFFAAEVLIAIFASVLFMLVFIAAGYAAYRAD